MDSKQYEPGDVAMVTYRLGQCTEMNVCAKVDKGWDCLAPGVGFLMHGDVIDAHRLVVIDPEDREQVERLWAALDVEAILNATKAHGVGYVQVALREFANPKPPKPPEPTGLGAVVEDANGVRWVAGPGVPGGRRWEPDHGGEARDFAEVDAVGDPLSEGVTQ